MNICFDVTNQVLVRTDSNVLVDLSNNYLYCNFSFKSSDWSSLTKFGLFKSRGVCYKVALVEDSCLVPHEVLMGDFFIVSVYGVDADDVRITANECKVYLGKSGYCTTTEESEIESNPSLVEDIYIRLNKTVEMEVTFTDGSSEVYDVVVK